MSAQILDGKKASQPIYDAIRLKISKRPFAPGLAVILVGDDPASAIYVKNKQRSCQMVGIDSYFYHLPINTSEKKLLKLINTLNHDSKIHGILVQLPLPAHMDTNNIIMAISPSKDVDGFHPLNLGCLAQRNPKLRPCTPYGIMQLLKFYNLSPIGKHAVVVGASNIVGRPMALELLHAGATVTICHSSTVNLKKHVAMADILVVAAGKQDIVTSDWLNSSQIVIDVGIHRKEDGKIRGDLNFAACREVVNWITPVPGGVGPMTITTLLENTTTAAYLAV